MLAMIALGWILPDSRHSGRLPKYNPERKKTFSLSDWNYVCRRARSAFSVRGLTVIAEWIERQALNKLPRKRDQDCLDACICLLVALYLAEGRDSVMVGNTRTGYIIVPDSADLRAELSARCRAIGRVPSEWVSLFRLKANPQAHDDARASNPPKLSTL